MGQIHNELRRTFLSEAIKRALGDTKPISGIERYGETLTPTVNLWERPEWALLRLEQPWARFALVAAVALEFGGVAIANPAGSGKLVVIEKVSVFNLSAAGGVVLALTTRAILAATYGFANPVARDTRIASQLLSVPELWFGSDGVQLAGTLLDQQNFPAANDPSRPFTALPVILSPSFGLVAEATVINQTVGATFSGYVRNALPGELV